MCASDTFGAVGAGENRRDAKVRRNGARAAATLGVLRRVTHDFGLRGPARAGFGGLPWSNRHHHRLRRRVLHRWDDRPHRADAAGNDFADPRENAAGGRQATGG